MDDFLRENQIKTVTPRRAQHRDPFPYPVVSSRGVWLEQGVTPRRDNIKFCQKV